ncbi:unnamed protein product [Parascedosporium putredinis]|uniref:Glycosyl hydrolase family 13 catalytic domain-containing protein n=1 Tax=Parascedosporium putredinis TaxID=1442378 RepID=A0A9P1HAU3_9PEZI|nr:unnamed protein product [Parascedosporium putredinis]CAI8004893.1 unnamed protein product [Parascedosporium putredinis]
MDSSNFDPPAASHLPSPMRDYGYDVSDYRAVDPIFGTLEDFDAVIAEAHRLHLKIIVDLVISHTSEEHAWFRESRSSRDNPRADWYWDARREQYYLHNFLAEQPDLNFHCGPVQDVLLDTTRFWLERGVDGFRLDTVNLYFHSPGLENNPALAPADRDFSAAPSVNPYNYQDHVFDKNRPENLAFLRRFRSLLDEVGAARVREIVERFEGAVPDGWCCWALSNHDTTRAASRWAALAEADPVAHLKVVAALLMSVRGSLCIYQGEELGLTEADLAFEDLRDPYGIRFWPEFKGRDGCRTPMVWEAEAPHGGFSDANPWLPVPVEHRKLAVDVQQGHAGSMLEHYRRMLRFRASQQALREDDSLLEAGRRGTLRQEPRRRVYHVRV